MPSHLSPYSPPNFISQALPSTVPPLFFTGNTISLHSYTAQVAALFFTTLRVSAAFKQQYLGSDALNFKATWGSRNSNISILYQIWASYSLSVTRFFIHFRIATVWNKIKRIKPPTLLFLLELVIYTNRLYFVFEGARNASTHTYRGSADKQWLTKMQYISCSLSCTWYAYSLAILLLRAMCQNKPKKQRSPGKGRMLPAWWAIDSSCHFWTAGFGFPTAHTTGYRTNLHRLGVWLDPQLWWLSHEQDFLSSTEWQVQSILPRLTLDSSLSLLPKGRRAEITT